jgi:alkylhydroperoxidase/carboxymuconolactone decarboxylase family protein YurZ
MAGEPCRSFEVILATLLALFSGETSWPKSTNFPQKLALAIGASSEGAVHSHARRAIAEGIAPEQLKHVAILAIPTVGFPQAVRAMTWLEDIIG